MIMKSKLQSDKKKLEYNYWVIVKTSSLSIFKISNSLIAEKLLQFNQF